MFRTVKDYQMPAPSPDSVAGSEGRCLISRRSINDRFRRVTDGNYAIANRQELPLSRHSQCARPARLGEN